MAEKSWALSKPPFAGLFFRVGKYSWFWGWKKPAPAAASLFQTTTEQSPPEPVPAWSDVGEWLKRMHARADHPPADSMSQEQ